MINAIINFTKGLLEDSNNDIMSWNVPVEDGLYVFIDMDQNGTWKNKVLQKNIDFVLINKNTESPLLSDCVQYNEASACVGGNKWGGFDKKKKIYSCSPFAIAYNMELKQEDFVKFNLISKDGNSNKTKDKAESATDRRNKRLLIGQCLPYYKEKSIEKFELSQDHQQLALKFLDSFESFMDEIESLDEYKCLTSKRHFLKIFLRSISAEVQQKYYDNCINSDLFIEGEKANYGVCGFMTTYNVKKTFLYHRTASFEDGISFRIAKEDAECMRKFGLLVKRKVLPSVLPVFVDKLETNANLNYEVAKLFNENGNKLSYKQIICELFKKHPDMRYLQNMYLIYRIRATQSNYTIDDFDFVPQFNYKIENCELQDVISTEPFPARKIENVFDLEYYIACLFPRYKKETDQEDIFIVGHYFDTKIEDSFKVKNKVIYETSDLVMQSYYKYRHQIFDYVYKSINNAITWTSIDDMAFVAVMTDIRKDENHNKFSSIKNKINIWFSLYNYFKENTDNMASKVQSLKEKVYQVAEGDATLDNIEEFAFAAGQVVYYLLTLSASSNKSYALLEPYIQKQKSGLLQDVITDTISIYKHELLMCKGAKRTRFENLSANVLTFDTEIKMKPLMKYFLAGCFSDCVIFKKKEESSN